MRSVILLAMAAGIALAQVGVPADQALREVQADREKAAQVRLQMLKTQLAAAQARLEDLRKRYSDSYPDVRTQQDELLQLQDELKATQKALMNSQLKQLKKELSAALPAGNDAPKIPLPDRWWRNAVTAQYLALTAEQQQKMDGVVNGFRDDLSVEARRLKVAERALDPLVSAEPLDEAKTTAQIDRVADSRAELEKTNGRMLLGIRELLTPDQWTKLNQAFTLSLIQK